MLCIYHDLPNAMIITNQVRHKGVWGTVCSSDFGKGEASVFCRFLFLRTMQPLFNVHHIVNNFGVRQKSSACLLASIHVVIIAWLVYCFKWWSLCGISVKSIWNNFVLTNWLAQDAWIRRECNIWVAGQRPPPSQTTKRILANLDHTAGRGYIHFYNIF